MKKMHRFSLNQFCLTQVYYSLIQIISVKVEVLELTPFCMEISPENIKIYFCTYIWRGHK